MTDPVPSEGAAALTFEEFDGLYRALTGHDGACQWQYRLFGELEAGRFPTDVELATGLGKTSIIALWVLALWRAIGRSPCILPRRLAYVVDRRVVVDQASEFAEDIRSRLDAAANDSNHALHTVASTLRDTGCTAAARETGRAEPFALVDGQTLTVRVDGGPVQVITFFAREFASIGAATAAEIAAAIDPKIAGAKATVTTGGTRVTITSDRRGTPASVEVAGTANACLGFPPSALETSTLRGQRALDTRWRDDPSRPAIVVGTVDMIGSRLLFSGYGRIGPWGRSLEAGLLGQDCLVVLDEAHLCSPFAATLAALEHHRREIAPFAVVRMGATMAPVTDLLGRTPGLPVQSDTSAERGAGGQPFRLRPEEIAEKKVSDRLNAPKLIAVEPTDPDQGAGTQLAAWAIGQASESQTAAIGLVLNTVAEARGCAEALRARGTSSHAVVTLTGSMRGWDRDAVIESAEYGRFRSQRDRSMLPAGPAFLVATSCVEVGADIDCDHLGTEACAADSLIQRLGRVNRLGLQTDGASVIVVGDPEEHSPAGRVFTRLRELAGGQALDGASAKLPERLLDGGDDDRGLLGVRVPPPALTPAVLDDLAMTSKYPDAGARPDVGRWLHGSVEEASLYIELAWRAELDWITEPEGASRLLNAFPIAARETARCPVYEAVNVLGAIRARAVEDSALGARLVLVTRLGTTTGTVLRALPQDEADLRRLIGNALIVLPTSAGGYDGRFVDPSAKTAVVDVAEDAQPSSRAGRRRLWVRSGRVSTATTSIGSSETDRRLFIDVDTTEDELIAEIATPARILIGAGWRLTECAGNARTGIVVAREDRRAIEEAEEDDASLGFRGAVLLERHLGDARSKAEALCDRMRVPEALRKVVVEAAGQHDVGKDRPWWQRAVGRVDRPPVAKSWHPRFDHTINRGYRHELGSVADLDDAGALESFDPSLAELCLHLVAAHHGHARPGFRAEAAGPLRTDAVKRAIAATPARFARMQAMYGWWGLAWLEALVKAADVLASREEEGAAP